MHIVGTAGHVDHGKSSLVRALTGTDPDRWSEEQRRGMTLDLGFAHLAFDDGIEAGIIDVPGHERFLHNMLAGAAGMEIVLLVVAANEGAKPQTLEHLAILRYLNVQRTLVVLTKADTVDAQGRRNVEAQLREALHGTIARDAALYPVSTLTGDGLAALRDGIHDALAALPVRAHDAPAYLPIDRVFALPGHGTIVTGTLMQGRISIGDTLVLAPLARAVRVRSLQVFGRARTRVGGGTRVAINLPGVETGDIARGAVLASTQSEMSTRLSVRFHPLAGALGMLKRRTPVRAYIGSAEILATLVLDTVPERADAVDATLLLRTPTVVIPRAPFVLRRSSPMTVLGGGTIAAASLASLTTDDPATQGDEHAKNLVLAVLRKTALDGATSAQAGAAANISEGRVTALLAQLVTDGRAIVVAKPHAYLANDVAGDVFGRAAERLEQRQRERPWLMGLTSIALAQALTVAEPAIVRVLAAYVGAGLLAYRSGYYATPDFRPQLTPEQSAFFDAVFAGESGRAVLPVPFDQLRARMRASNLPDLSAAFETLVADGDVSKVGEYVYRGAHIGAIRAQLEAALLRSGQLTVAQFRDVTGTSRKYAVPLLEFFDATGVTIRSGDVRVLRKTSHKPI